VPSQGYHGAPSPEPTATELIDISPFPHQIRRGSFKQLPVIDLLHLLDGKLAYHSARRRQQINGAENDLTDLTFLVQRYRAQIPPLRNQLNLEHRREFIDGAIEANSPHVATMKQTLGLQGNDSIVPRRVRRKL
jgi:hypothetical protein